MHTDIAYTLQKVAAGAEYIVTQMFFDNAPYFKYVDECRTVGINVPIIPGLKVLTVKNHLHTLPDHFQTTIPSELQEQVESTGTGEQVEEAGILWTARQIEELIEYGVPAVHLYVMQNPRPIVSVLQLLKLRGVIDF